MVASYNNVLRSLIGYGCLHTSYCLLQCAEIDDCNKTDNVIVMYHFISLQYCTSIGYNWYLLHPLVRKFS